MYVQSTNNIYCSYIYFSLCSFFRSLVFLFVLGVVCCNRVPVCDVIGSHQSCNLTETTLPITVIKTLNIIKSPGNHRTHSVSTLVLQLLAKWAWLKWVCRWCLVTNWWPYFTLKNGCDRLQQCESIWSMDRWMAASVKHLKSMFWPPGSKLIAHRTWLTLT